MKKWLWLIVLATSVSADIIRLNDGTVLTGDILAETATNLTLEVQIAHGTIMKTEVVSKSNVASFERWTPEQKRVVAMQRAYLALAKYTLNPDTSATIAAYDQAIGDFQNFLTTYAGSSYEQDVTDRLAEWQAERKQVAAGMIKLEGAWLTKEESEKRQARAKSQILVKQGNDAMTAKQWAQAVRAYDALIALHVGGVTETLASRQVTEALTAWRADLEPQLKQLEPELAAAQSRFDQAKRAQGSLKQSQSKLGQPSNDGKLGADGTNFMRAQGELTSAEAQLQALRPRVEQMRAQLAEINRRLGTTAPAVVAARDAAPPSTDVLQDTASWWEKYWMLFVGIALVGLWLVNRIMSR